MDERALVLRAQSGDRNAFDELLRIVQRPLHRYIAAITPKAAEDVLQDVFIRIIRNIGWLNDPSLFRPWAYRIASREAFRTIRKERRMILEPLEDTAADIKFDDPWIRERLKRSTDSLPPASRAVIALHYFEEMTLVETASILDVNVGTVKSRLAYGLALLRKEIS
jgi:RNA polymerase sigma-70 factor (ECF subfamily)